MHSFSPAERAIDDAEAKAAFHLRLRARGVRDLAVLRAFEVVMRAQFVPPRHVALAARDIPLPIPCGQTSHEPWRYALAVEALGVEPNHRVLEVGSGSGYVTAILAQLAGEVRGVERWGALAVAAQRRLADNGIANASVAWADGLAMPTDAVRFDRILLHGTIPEEASLDGLLAPSGRIVVCPFAPLSSGLAGHHLEEL